MYCASYVWNKCKIFKNKWLNVNPDNCNENLQNEENIETELSKICPPSVSSDPSFFPDCNPSEFFDNPFSFAYFNNALFMTKSSPDQYLIYHMAFPNIL